MDCVCDALFLVNQAVMQVAISIHDDGTNVKNVTFDRKWANHCLLSDRCSMMLVVDQRTLLQNLYSNYCKKSEKKKIQLNKIKMNMLIKFKFLSLFGVFYQVKAVEYLLCNGETTAQRFGRYHLMCNFNN